MPDMLMQKVLNIAILYIRTSKTMPFLGRKVQECIITFCIAYPLKIHYNRLINRVFEEMLWERRSHTFPLGLVLTCSDAKNVQ